MLYLARPSLLPQLDPGLRYAFTPANSWLLLGGFFGSLSVTSNIVLSPLISVTGVTVNNLLGRLVLAMALDVLGGFGVERKEVGIVRVGGACLVFAGVVFTSWRAFKQQPAAPEPKGGATSIYAQLEEDEGEGEREGLLEGE